MGLVYTIKEFGFLRLEIILIMLGIWFDGVYHVNNLKDQYIISNISEFFG